MVSIGLADTLAYYTAQDLADGFKTTLAFQVHVIKQKHGSSRGHVEHWCGERARILHARGVYGWLLEATGVPHMRRQVE